MISIDVETNAALLRIIKPYDRWLRHRLNDLLTAMTRIKDVCMTVDRFHCTSCPEDFAALELIETRFEHGLCYLELICKSCQQLWTGEVSIQDSTDMPNDELYSRKPRSRWRLIRMMPRQGTTVPQSVPH